MYDIETQLQLLLPVVISAILAAIPGLDRERRMRPAGLRTHMLVGVSSTMITVMARHTLDPDSAARMTANIITGIGFLGSGIIIQRKHDVYDVTTAASIWMVALLGIVVGYELYVFAVGSTFILGFILTILRAGSKKRNRRPPKQSNNTNNEQATQELILPK